MSTTYTLHFNERDKDLYVQTKTCAKPIEIRAATYKYKDIRTGDIIIFQCNRNYFTKQVKSVGIFKSFTALCKKYDLKQIMPDAKSVKDVEKRLYSFPGYRDRIKKHGIIAMELC